MITCDVCIGVGVGWGVTLTGDDRAILEHVASQSRLQHGVRFHVYGGCCFVQNQDVAWSQESAGEGDELTLA